MAYSKTLISRIQILLFLGFVLWGLINFFIFSYQMKYQLVAHQEIPKVEFWIVLWSKVQGNTPSDILRDRLKVALEYYKNWYIRKILVTGDGQTELYNETRVMEAYLEENGVPKGAILEDFYGVNTFASFQRAKQIYHIDKAYIFTQNFHLARSLFIARKLWIEAWGISTDLETYVQANRYEVREYISRIKAFFEVEFFS